MRARVCVCERKCLRVSLQKGEEECNESETPVSILFLAGVSFRYKTKRAQLWRCPLLKCSRERQLERERKERETKDEGEKRVERESEKKRKWERERA